MSVARLLLVSDFNLENLRGCLAASESAPRVEADCLRLSSLATSGGARYDAAIVWTRPQAVAPSFRKLLDYQPVDGDRTIAEVDAYADRLAALTSRAEIVLATTWVMTPGRHGLGPLENYPRGAAFELARMNLHLAERLSAIPGCYLLGAQRWLDAAGGAQAQSSKLWSLIETPFRIKCFQEAADDIKAVLRAASGDARSLLVLDTDDTLWGGAADEVGWKNLRLGGKDPIGQAFVEFQMALLALRRREVRLALIGDGNEAIALEAIDQHPAMVLSQRDFAGWRIGWESKPDKLRALSQELGVPLSQIVYIDDGAADRTRMRDELPEVLTPEWPRDKTSYARTLAELNAFDAVPLAPAAIRAPRLAA